MEVGGSTRRLGCLRWGKNFLIRLHSTINYFMADERPKSYTSMDEVTHFLYLSSYGCQSEVGDQCLSVSWTLNLHQDHIFINFIHRLGSFPSSSTSMVK